MFQRIGGWWEAGTYAMSEWVCEKHGERQFFCSSIRRRTFCVKEKGIDATMLRTSVKRCEYFAAYL